MLQHALTPEEPGSPGQDIATYGALMERARETLAVAVRLPSDRFTSAQDARQELLGYLRFVRVAGQHVDLLGRLVGGDAEEVRTFGRHLSTAAPREAGPSSWNSAATFLGAGHDLLASHVEAGLTYRTPDAEAWLTHQRLLSAAMQTIQMLTVAAGARGSLTR